MYKIFQTNHFPYLGQSIWNIDQLKQKNGGKQMQNNLLYCKMIKQAHGLGGLVSGGFPQIFCYLCY